MFNNSVEGLYFAVVRAAALKHVTPRVAHQVLFEMGRVDSKRRIGYPGGNFTRKLISAALSADDFNLAKIGEGFPEYAAAVQLAKYDTGGIDLLREIIIADEMARDYPNRSDDLPYNAQRGTEE